MFLLHLVEHVHNILPSFLTCIVPVPPGIDLPQNAQFLKVGVAVAISTAVLLLIISLLSRRTRNDYFKGLPLQILSNPSAARLFSPHSSPIMILLYLQRGPQRPALFIIKTKNGISTDNSEIFEKKQELRSRNYHHHLYDDETIETMKQYFKVEDSHDTLLNYIKKNRILHDALTEL